MKHLLLIVSLVYLSIPMVYSIDGVILEQADNTDGVIIKTPGTNICTNCTCNINFTGVINSTGRTYEHIPFYDINGDLTTSTAFTFDTGNAWLRADNGVHTQGIRNINDDYIVFDATNRRLLDENENIIATFTGNKFNASTVPIYANNIPYRSATLNPTSLVYVDSTNSLNEISGTSFDGSTLYLGSYELTSDTGTVDFSNSQLDVNVLIGANYIQAGLGTTANANGYFYGRGDRLKGVCYSNTTGCNSSLITNYTNIVMTNITTAQNIRLVNSSGIDVGSDSLQIYNGGFLEIYSTFPSFFLNESDCPFGNCVNAYFMLDGNRFQIQRYNASRQYEVTVVDGNMRAPGSTLTWDFAGRLGFGLGTGSAVGWVNFRNSTATIPQIWLQNGTLTTTKTAGGVERLDDNIYFTQNDKNVSKIVMMRNISTYSCNSGNIAQLGYNYTDNVVYYCNSTNWRALV